MPLAPGLDVVPIQRVLLDTDYAANILPVLRPCPPKLPYNHILRSWQKGLSAGEANGSAPPPSFQIVGIVGETEQFHLKFGILKFQFFFQSPFGFKGHLGNRRKIASKLLQKPFDRTACQLQDEIRVLGRTWDAIVIAGKRANQCMRYLRCIQSVNHPQGNVLIVMSALPAFGVGRVAGPTPIGTALRNTPETGPECPPA